VIYLGVESVSRVQFRESSEFEFESLKSSASCRVVVGIQVVVGIRGVVGRLSGVVFGEEVRN
jgi:hypothetical protein